jgi:S-DNA-T family DNA segregation ATPase FtsK/SpoIIIE
MAAESKICLFIGDMPAFCEMVYHPDYDMKSFMELMLARGDGHMIYLFACVSVGDMTGEWNTKPAMRRFIGWKEGVHMGGAVDSQKIFDFDVPVLERGRRLPAGSGHMNDGGVTKRVAVMTV